MTLSTFFYVRNIIMASSILSVPAVPGDATVFYTLELLSSRPEDELETLPLSERRKIGYVNFVPWMFSVVKIFCLLSSFSFICRNRKREREGTGGMAEERIPWLFNVIAVHWTTWMKQLVASK